jgi:hypothetical protein
LVPGHVEEITADPNVAGKRGGDWTVGNTRVSSSLRVDPLPPGWMRCCIALGVARFCLAGFAAEEIWSGLRPAILIELADVECCGQDLVEDMRTVFPRDDIVQAWDHIALVYQRGGASVKRLQREYDIVLAFLRTHRSPLDDLSRALYKAGTLDGGGIHAIVDDRISHRGWVVKGERQRYLTKKIQRASLTVLLANS